MSEGEGGRCGPPDKAHSARTDDAALRERDKAYADINELQQRLAAAQRQLREERVAREKVTKGRKSRLTRSAREVVRAAVEFNRALRGRVRARRWSRASTASARSKGATGVPNPFFARVESLYTQTQQADVDSSNDIEGLTGAPVSPDVDPPLVSIIMVVNDVAISVDDCVESVLQQTYRRWELIIRDCRRRGWLEPAVGTHDERVSSVWVRARSEGVARNSGLAAAQGELIAYLDPPNLWHPRFLETLVPVVIGDRSRYLAYCDRLEVPSAEAPVEPVLAEEGQFDYAELVGRGIVALNAVVHRRELYDEIGGAKDCRIGHDRDLVLKYTFIRDPWRVPASLLLQQAAERSRSIAAGSAFSVPSLRVSAETYFRNGLAQPADARPGLTVATGVGRLAHEKAWDLAAVAGGVTFSQLVSFRFGERPTSGRRLLPAPETRMISLEGGSFPKWASMLARGAANVHGDVVYAAEPRLPSLGLALLASYHYGTRVLADLSYPPAIEEPPVQLDAVDPRDPELLDPCSPLWDRIMVGIARTLPSCVVGSLAAAEQAIPHPLVLHNPKDDAALNPSRYERDLVRHRFGIGEDEHVLVCGCAPTERGVDRRLDLLDRLGSRFRLVLLNVDRSGELSGVESAKGNPQIVDRADEAAVAEALAASDALLLWRDPQAPTPSHDSSSELIRALAMGVPVIANNVEEFNAPQLNGGVRLVEYGDLEGLADCVNAIRRDHERWRGQAAEGRHLFIRQYSYTAARVNLSIILRLVNRKVDTEQSAKEFARFFSAFYRHANTVGGSDR